MLFGFGLPLLMGLIALAFMALNRDASSRSEFVFKWQRDRG